MLPPDMRIQTLLLAATLTLVHVASAAKNDTADFLLAEPSGHMDKVVQLQVSHVKTVGYESQVNNVTWFYARTGYNGQGSYRHFKFESGGQMRVAVDADNSASFFQSYGTERRRSDGYVSTRVLTGIFRAADKSLKLDTNSEVTNYISNSGLYFLDCTTKGQFKKSEKPVSQDPQKTTE